MTIELEDRPEWRGAAPVMVLLLAATTGAALWAEGFHHVDDVTHYLYARAGWIYPSYLLNDWGRPGFTALYCLPSQLGLKAARLTSVVLSAAAAWMAFLIAGRMRLRYSPLVAPLVYAQPLFLTLSLTTLTETALAFYLTAAVFLAQRGRWGGAAALISLGCVTRHEAIVFVPVLALAAWQAGVAWWRLWPVVWAPAVVNGLCWAAELRPPLLLLFDARPSTQYGRGGWLTYLCRAMEAWGPALTAMGFVGLGRLWRDRTGRFIAGCIAIYFAAQTIVRALGVFDSGGYPRFLVPLSPLLAVSAAACWEQLVSGDALRRTRAARGVGMAFGVLWLAMEVQLGRPETPAYMDEVRYAKWALRAAAAVTMLLSWVIVRGARPPTGLTVTSGRPAEQALRWVLVVMMAVAFLGLSSRLPRLPAQRALDDALAWVEAHGYAGRPIESGHAYVEMRLDRLSPLDRPALRERLDAAAAGTLFIWDRQFAPYARPPVPLSAMAADPTWRELFRGAVLPYGTEPEIRIFEKQAAASRPAAVDE